MWCSILRCFPFSELQCADMNKMILRVLGAFQALGLGFDICPGLRGVFILTMPYLYGHDKHFCDSVGKMIMPWVAFLRCCMFPLIFLWKRIGLVCMQFVTLALPRRNCIKECLWREGTQNPCLCVIYESHFSFRRTFVRSFWICNKLDNDDVWNTRAIS